MYLFGGILCRTNLKRIFWRQFFPTFNSWTQQDLNILCICYHFLWQHIIYRCNRDPTSTEQSPQNLLLFCACMNKLVQICREYVSASKPPDSSTSLLTNTDFPTKICFLQVKVKNASTLAFQPPNFNSSAKTFNSNYQTRTFEGKHWNIYIQSLISIPQPLYSKINLTSSKLEPSFSALNLLSWKHKTSPAPCGLERQSRSWWSDLTRSRAWCLGSGGWSPRRQPGSSGSWEEWGTPCTSPRPLP